MNTSFPIIIVDDEENTLITVAGALKAAGFSNIHQCDSADKVFPLLAENNPALVLLDLFMPGKSGKELLPEIGSSYPESLVVILTGISDLETAVDCIRNGAYDFLVKPFDPERFKNCLQHAVDFCSIRFDMARLNEKFFAVDLQNRAAFAEILTNDDAMLKIFAYSEAVALGNQPVLITGETGVGKELLAKAIHALSGRKGKFVPVNIAGLDVTMVNSMLFGHIKGAFTGAVRDKKGLVEEAAGGTLFLDEIGDLNMEAQVKLIRLLQEYEFTPVGGLGTRKVDIRIVTATHMDLYDSVEEGRFRKDLYFRITTHPILIPPLRERLNDLKLLLDSFLGEAAAEYHKKKPTYPPELISLLKTYHFPGNIRELRSMVFDAVRSHKSKKLSMQAFRERIKKQRNKCYINHSPEHDIIFPEVLPTLKSCTKNLIDEAMKRAGKNQKIAAESLGVTQQALNQRLRREGKL